MEYKLVNGVMGDPSVYVFNSRTGESLLFDLGSLQPLSHKEILKVRYALVSHTHMDHFIGFDHWLRIHVPHKKKLTVIGPEGICENVYGKLKGYLWDLLEPDQIRFDVFEIKNDLSVEFFELSNTESFKPKKIKDFLPSNSNTSYAVTPIMDGRLIKSTYLDHSTNVLAFVIEEPTNFYVNKERLFKLNLKAGPWISDLQSLLSSQQNLPETIVNRGKKFNTQEIVKEIFYTKSPLSFGYITDILFSHKNLEKIEILFSGVQRLICESNYRAHDFKKAFAKKHLTTKQAALIAALVKANVLEVFHFSAIYAGEEIAMKEEAQNLFNTFKQLDPHSLRKEIDDEIKHAL